MDITIITITYNNEKNITQFLNSIKKETPKNCELIIIDNNSTDKTCEKILKFRKENNLDFLKLIEMSENVGFSKANNLGAKISSSPLFLFLNPDTVINKTGILLLEKFINDNKEVGIAVPQLVKENGQVQASVRNTPSLKKAIEEYWFGSKNEYSEYIPKGDEPVSVEGAYGACMMIKKDVFENVGGFNEKYFLYYEDLDLCRKVSDKGLKVYYLPVAKIVHLLGGSNDLSKNEKKENIASEFFPIKQSGRRYYQIKSSNIFHGFLISFLIHFVIFLSQTVKKNNQ